MALSNKEKPTIQEKNRFFFKIGTLIHEGHNQSKVQCHCNSWNPILHFPSRFGQRIGLCLPVRNDVQGTFCR